MSIRKLVYLSAIVLLSGAQGPVMAQNNSAQADLQKKLAATYTITTVTKDRSDIVTPGVVVALQKDKFLGYSTASPLPPLSTFKNGKISQGWGNVVRDLLITSMMGGKGSANDLPRQAFNTGDKLWVVGVAVSSSSIGLVLYSDPDANNIRYYGQLNIPFHKGDIPSSDDALKMVSEVLTVQPPDTSEEPSPAAAQPAPTPLTPLAPPAGAPAAPALAPLTAPPPPPAVPPAPPTKISMGETTGQVRSSLGEPQKVVSLGAKEIDFYPNLKITFVNGKVTGLE